MVHKVKRKLTTIFCADVVGYSRLMGADEHGTLRRLKECRELIQAFIERHHGRVVSWSGDAVLADFSSVVESVQCAVEIQRELKAQNDTVPETQRMNFRIGINLGDVMIDEHDIFGEGVNIAARLQALATPGGILISGSVHDQVKNKLALGFNFMGHQQVKNINDQVPVFVVAHDAAPSLPIGAGFADTGARGAAKAPALLPLRFGAAVIDAVVACALLFLATVSLNGVVGPVFAIDAPFTLLASERVVSSDLPSIEVAGGAERTTTRSLIERDYFGALRQTFRRVDVEEKRQEAGRAGARSVSRSSSETLLDGRRRGELLRPPFSISAIVFFFLLAIVWEGLLLRGASPGKLVMGLRVSGTNGEAVDLGRAAIRNLGKLLSVPSVIGLVMALWSKRGQALHDQFAGAYVHDAK
ncbi:MAG: RDD family protein [Alphaproteobacteria bacterium]|nr:RDD family protein [Alphaproteobacteria bacterium]